MNILEVSIQLRELSNGYSSQRVGFDEYRLKRKLLLDGIDQRINQQDCEVTRPHRGETAAGSAGKDDVIPL